MYESRNGQEIIIGQRVRVYKNLHRDCWSIQNEKGTKVLGYAKTVRLQDVSFHVSEKGRQRVLETKQKGIHAKVYGIITGFDAGEEKDTAYYNPYKTDKFIDREGNPLDACNSATMVDSKIFISA